MAIALGLAACGSPPTVRTDWGQCPPPGVELQDCVHPAVTLDGYQPGYIQELEKLCASPCRSIESLTLRALPFKSLTELTPLAHFERMGGLWLNNNRELTDLHGLESLVELGGLLIDAGNSANKLRTLRGLDNVSKIQRIEIWGGDSLVELGAFSKVESVDTVELHGFALSDVSSLSNLKSVTSLGIGQTALKDLSAFQNLEEVKVQLNITSNENLTSLSGLSSLRSVLRGIIDNNPRLPQCEVEAFLERFDREKFYTYSNNTTAVCEPQ